jgi:hypothetical protein
MAGREPTPARLLGEVGVPPLPPEQQAALAEQLAALKAFDDRSGLAEQLAALKAFGDRSGLTPERVLADLAESQRIADRLDRAIYSSTFGTPPRQAPEPPAAEPVRPPPAALEPVAPNPMAPSTAESGAQPSTPKHAGGAPPKHDWDGAVCHVNDWVAENGPLPRHKNGEPNKTRAVELMTEWFKDVMREKPPTPGSIARWIRHNPHPEWWNPN